MKKQNQSLIIEVETRITFPDGRVIKNIRKFPEGITREEYRRIDLEMVKVYGSQATKTIGTFATKYKQI